MLEMHLKMSSHNDQGEGVGARDASTHLKMSSYISIRVRAIWTGSSVVSTLSIKSAIQVIIPLQSVNVISSSLSSLPS